MITAEAKEIVSAIDAAVLDAFANLRSAGRKLGHEDMSIGMKAQKRIALAIAEELKAQSKDAVFQYVINQIKDQLNGVRRF